MPERTCVGCGERAEAADAVRLVAHPVTGALVVDYPGKLPGRGAWVHPRASCVQAAQRRTGLLRRSLRVEVDTSQLAADLRAAVLRSVLDGVSMAAASGVLVGGHDMLVQALREERVRWVIVADDCAPRTLRSLEEAAQPDVSFVTLPLGREELGRRIGRGARAALGVAPSKVSRHLLRQLRRLLELG